MRSPSGRIVAGLFLVVALFAVAFGCHRANADDQTPTAEIDRYLNSIYPGPDSVLIWRQPVSYALIGLEKHPDLAEVVFQQMAELGKISRWPITQAVGDAKANILLIFSDDPESLAADEGMQLIFIGAGRKQKFSDAQVAALRQSLAKLDQGASQLVFMTSKTDMVLVAGIAHTNIFKRHNASGLVEGILFSSLVFSRGSLPSGVDSILAEQRQTGRLSLLDKALLRVLYTDPTLREPIPIPKAQLRERLFLELTR